MDKIVKKILWCSLATLLVVVIIGVILFYKPSVQSNFGGMGSGANNLIGTRVSTTTTGVAWGAATTTNRYTHYIGADVDEVTFFLQTTAAVASSSVLMNIFASNDQYCNTATTSTTMNVPTVSEINWYDASYLIKDLAGSATIAVATGTVTWYPKTAQLKKIINLENVNARCLALEVASADTSLYAAITKKQR